MSLGGRYLSGVGAVAVLASGLVLGAPADLRPAAASGMAVALLVQVPLGWWVLRRLGTDRFLGAWGVGVLSRFTLVVLAGVIALPLVGRQAGAMLGAMVGIMMALLLVEAVAAARQR